MVDVLQEALTISEPEQFKVERQDARIGRGGNTTVTRSCLDTSVPLSVLKEARESWEYVLSDKFIHLIEFGQAGVWPILRISESNAHLEGLRWMELHFSLHGQSEDEHYVAIVEPLGEQNWNGISELNKTVSSGDRNSPMLRNIAKLIICQRRLSLNKFPA